MEKKTKKVTAKKTTVEPKKIEKKVSKKELVSNTQAPTIKVESNYNNILNKIFICLVVISALLAINIIVNVVKGGSTTKSTETTTTEEPTGEYDVSAFKTLTTTEAIDKVNQGKTEVIYIGRATCGYCVKFIPVLKQAQKDLGYTTTYINLEEVSTEDQAKLVAYDNYVKENFGYTPMVLVFKDGKYVDGWVGYAEIDSFKSFLADAGVK